LELNNALLVALGAFLAGGMNAVAGGGTFFSFPALLGAGLPPIMANATNTVGLCPASLISAWAYRREVLRHGRWAALLMVLSFVGGICGGLLLLATTNEAFARLIPWLLLIATTLFAFSSQVSRLIKAIKGRLGGNIGEHKPGSPGGALFQFIVAVYGGFFGAGMGILTIAALSIQGFDDIQEVNALKNLTSGINYFVTSATFIIAGAISWPFVAVMLVAAMAGGYAGATLARRLPAMWLRRLVVAVGTVLSAVYFVKIYA